MPARVLLIGLDGWTFDLVDPWIAEGLLPNLAALCARGSRALLRSTVPPVTFPAWTTILTGRSPDRHGLVDFTIHEPGARRLRFASAADRQGPTIGRLVSDAGGRAVLIGFPATYPPEPLNGIAVSGFDSPLPRGLGRDFVTPPEALREAERACGPYLTTDIDETRKRRGWHRRALERLLLTAARRACIASSLVRRDPWDLFAVHFGEADTASHHFWAICDPDSPRHRPELVARFGNAIRLVYQALDRAVGELVEAAGPDATVCLVSDHGFGGTSDRVVYLNRYLETRGLCRLATPTGRARGLALARAAGVSLLPAAVQSAVFRRARTLANHLEGAARFGVVDFAASRAWSEELPYFPSVHLNLYGRDPGGNAPAAEADAAVSEVVAALSEMRDPVDGGLVFERVARREELFDGPFADRYPDVVAFPRFPGGYAYHFGRSDSSRREWFAQMAPGEHLGRKGSSMNGSHRPEGVFVLAGQGARTGADLAAADARDVTPTLLHLLGLAVREGMDGRVLAGVLAGDAAARPVRVEPDAGDGTPPGSPGGDRDHEVARRLRSLGYLG